MGLVGPLGAGKTLLVQGLARGLGVPAGVAVTSPSYSLVVRHDGGRCPLVHADLYRIARDAELSELGLDDAIADGAVVVVEWIDRYPTALPADRVEIRLVPDGAGRLAEVFVCGRAGRALIDAL